MNEFFKFRWRKLLIALGLFLIIGIYLLFFGRLFIFDAAPPVFTMVLVYIFFWPCLIVIIIFGSIFERSTAVTDIPMGILCIIFNGLYFYFLGCLIDFVYRKIREYILLKNYRSLTTSYIINIIYRS